MWIRPLFSGLFLIAAVVAVEAKRRGCVRVYRTAKPAPMIFLILTAMLAPLISSPGFRWALVAGLSLSLVGDVLLMLPGRRLIEGIAFFFCAHLVYATAFLYGTTLWAHPWSILPFLAGGVAVAARLAPHLGRRKGPVFGYQIAIGLMGWRAFERVLQQGSAAAWLAFAGALFFIVSDTLLATREFVPGTTDDHTVVLVAYYLGQWLIALSV